MKRSCFVFPLSLLPLAAFAQVNYSEGFQGSVGAEWSSTSTIIVKSAANRIALGNFGNQTVTLTLGGFTPGVLANLKFDLDLLDSWDGSDGTYGPDRFTAQIDGTNVIDATFSNLNENGFLQSYSAATPLGGPLVAAYTNADETDTLDQSYYGNSVYKFGGGINPGFSFLPATSTVVFSFTATGLQGNSDESWALDNVSVVQSVPEPSTWAALGFGVVALKRRRNRR